MPENASESLPDYYEVLQVSPNADAEFIQPSNLRIVDKCRTDCQSDDPTAFQKKSQIDDTFRTNSVNDQKYDPQNTLLVADKNDQDIVMLARFDPPLELRTVNWWKLLAIVMLVLTTGSYYAIVYKQRGLPHSPTAESLESTYVPSKNDAETFAETTDRQQQILPSPDKLFVRVSPSVVQVICKDEKDRTVCGSGFVVTSARLIATNFHVISKARVAKVIFDDKTELAVDGVVAHDEEADIAILKLEKVKDVQWLELAGSALPPVGTKVFAIGNPLGVSAGLFNTMSDGLVSGHREFDGITQLQNTAPISPGSSGGPLFVADGTVIGVTTSSYKSGQNINIAIPSSYVSKLLLKQHTQGKHLAKFPLSHRKDVDDFIENGRMAGTKKNYDKAVSDFSAAITLDPSNVRALAFRGQTWVLKKEYEKAIKDLTQAIQLDPEYSRAYCYRGLAWVQKGEYDNALSDLNRAIRFDPGSSIAYGIRGRAMGLKKEYDKAIRDFAESIRLNPGNPTVYADRGITWINMKVYSKAILDFDEVIRLSPESAFAYFNRGKAKKELGEYADAARDFVKAINLDSKLGEGPLQNSWQVPLGTPEQGKRYGKLLKADDVIQEAVRDGNITQEQAKHARWLVTNGVAR